MPTQAVLTQLVLPAVVALAVLQLPLLLLARWLGRPLRREVVLVGLLLPWLLLAPWVAEDRVLAPANVLSGVLPDTEWWSLPQRHMPLNDAIYQLLPWELEVRRSLSAGRLPLWSDLADGGSSPWANPQAQTLSPVAMLARIAPLQHHLFVTLALKMLVALQGVWVLARLLGAAGRPALLAGAAFALGGGILPWALFPLSTTVAWLAWVAAGVVALARRPRGAAFVTVALSTAVMFLSGHPEAAAFGIVLAATVGLGVRHRRFPLRRFLAGAAAAGLLGFALAAPHLLPFTAVARRSLRAAERLESLPPPVRPLPGHDWFVGKGYRLFGGVLSPKIFGEPYGRHFAGAWGWPQSLATCGGLFALAGAAAAVAGRSRRRAAAPLLYWAGGLLVASRFVPLEWLLWHVPPLRVPEVTRLLPVGCLALVLAAGLGWSELARTRRRTPAVAALAALAVAVATTPQIAVIVPAGLLAVAVALLALATRRRRSGIAGVAPAVAAGVAAVALVVDLVPWGRAQLPADAAQAFYPASPLMTQLVEEAATGPWRAVGEDYHVYPGILSVYGVADPRFHNPLAPVYQRAVLGQVFGFAPDSGRYFASFRGVEHPLLDFLSVRVVLSNHYQPAKRRLVRADDGRPPGFLLFRNDAALPRWFVAPQVEVVPIRRALATIGALSDGRRVVLIDHEADGWRPAPQRWDASAVRPVVPPRPGALELAVGGSGERLLATSLPGPFGWRAWAGERELRTISVNGAYLGVRVPEGVGLVALRYRPPGLAVGTVLAAFAMVALAMVALSSRLRQSRP